MKTCLVVDDSPAIRKVACRILEDLQFEASEAEDGITALESCRRLMPDVILLDEFMPNMNGIQFLRNFKRAHPESHSSVFLCTTENDPNSIANALAAGAKDFIVKPFDMKLVQAKLAENGII